MMTKKPLSNAIKNLYGISDLGFGLMTAVEVTYFVFFLTNVAKFSVPMVALIGSVTSIVDAILSPFYGAIISGTKPLRWGRIRSWLLVAPPFVVMLYIFQFTKIGSEGMAAFIICAGFILSHIIWNIQWVANVSLIPTLASTPDERGFLASRRAAYGGLAGIIFSYLGLATINFFGKATGNQVLGYSITAGVMAFCMLIGSYILFKITAGYEPTGAEAAKAAAPGQRVTFGDMGKTLAQNPHLVVLLIGDFFRYMGAFITGSAAAFYFTYVAKDMKLLPVMLLVGAIARTAGSYFGAPVIKKFSTRTTSIVGLILAGGLMVVLKFFALNVTMVFIFLALSGICAAIAGVAIVGLYSDVAIYGEWKTGKNAAPFVMGLMNLSLKTAIISRGTVIPFVLAAAGFVSGIKPDAATPQLLDAVINVYVMIPGLFYLLCAAILGFAYKLTREKLNGYQAEIDARNAAARAIQQ